LPFRTEKLSPLAPMVLHSWESRSLPFLETLHRNMKGFLFLYVLSYTVIVRRFLETWKSLFVLK
ncbi:hypothetical protein Q4Q39_17630, partial [Flavivirga amylovorans]